jgi:hypothetical protein
LSTQIQLSPPPTSGMRGGPGASSAAPAVPKKAPPSLQHVLTTASKEAEHRSIEAQGLFQGISQALDQEIRAVKQKKLSQPLENAFSRFCEDIFTVAQAHFHSHICGSWPPPTLYPKALLGNTSTTPPNRLGNAQDRIPSRPLPCEEPTYASATKTAATPSTTPQKPPKPPLRQETQRDNRLFVRLHPTHPFRQLSSYAILDVLKNSGFPKEIREVQTVNSGLALCLATPTTRTALVTRIQEI